jgi:hypothetical protein
MSNWQLTATTVFCDTCGNEVTFMIYKEGLAKCTGTSKLSTTNQKMARAACSADTCKLVLDYKAKLDAEELIG